jgi:aconitase B
MYRDELKDLACLGFTADLVMQSFCHTAAYPKVMNRALSIMLAVCDCTDAVTGELSALSLTFVSCLC